MFENIRSIVEECIGSPRRDTDEWVEYNCPYCADEKGVESDGKYNLAINYGEDMRTKPFFHCWRCGTAGKLSKLLKDFGKENILSKYYRELKDIKSSMLYKINFNGDEEDNIQIETQVDLPNDFRRIQKDDRYAQQAISYLSQRGLGDFFIDQYKLGYIPYWSKDKEMRDRIIIPSYDAYGELNYFVARDYTGRRKYRKYNNPDLKKTLFIFNEGMINWYEDVTLVEGSFDHMVTPNSIPLMGKVLKTDYTLFKTIVKKAKCNVNVLLDEDARKDAVKVYKLLNSTKLRGRVRLIEYPYGGKDPSNIYQIYGRKGIIDLMRNSKKIDEFELFSV